MDITGDAIVREFNVQMHIPPKGLQMNNKRKP